MIGDLLVSFSAGAVSFFAPCVVPLLPAYVSYLGGAALPEIRRDPLLYRRRMIQGGLLFVAGFGTIFIALGVAAGFAGGAVVAEQKALVQRIGGVLVIVMGLALLGLLPGRLAERSFAPLGTTSSAAGSAPLLLGLVFGAAWTPCVGPVLAVILTLAAERGMAARGGLLLAAYTLGLGLPFVLCSLLAASFPAVMKPLARFSSLLSRVAGGLLVVLGVLLVLGIYQSLAGYLAQPFTLR